MLGFADFFRFNQEEETVNLQPGEDFPLPENGPSSGGITRINETTFNLSDIGSYQVMFTVTTIQTPKLGIALNDEMLANTIAGRSSGTSQIVGMTIVTTTEENTALSLRYPEDTSVWQTEPLVPPTEDTTSHLVIVQLN